MEKRVYTVGSLIPGSMNLTQAPTAHSIPVSTQRVKPNLEKIIVMQNGNRYEISPVKGNLLDIALSQGKSIQFKCRKGTCGQCKVKVGKGPRLSDPNEQELKKLNGELSNGYRLACQTDII
jgi:ferredoxin, 2Fe-2S